MSRLPHLRPHPEGFRPGPRARRDAGRLRPRRARRSTARRPTNVAWQDATSDADIDKAFAAAKAQNKPVLLYWGAVWCPPCNQLKATLFNRQDFAEQSQELRRRAPGRRRARRAEAGHEVQGGRAIRR